jgi:tripartite-type tricarboxylate transporter receptor subunit TctC
VVEAWLALYMPAKVPPAIVERTNQAVQAALKDPAIVAKLDSFGAVPAPSSTKALAEFTQSEVVRWAKVVKDANIQPQ